MRKIKSLFLSFFVMFGMLANTAFAVDCASNEFEVNGVCIENKFSVTTTTLPSNKTFKFVLSAAGTFYVDWGDGNTDMIDRQTPSPNTTPTEYSHTYASTTARTIKFGGLATAYNSTIYAKDKDSSGAAIRFGVSNSNISSGTGGTPTLIKTLSGSIGSVFPTLNNGVNASTDIPIFFEMCVGCTALESVSPTLFSGVTGAKKNMFRSVFDKCSTLTTVPGNLFSGVNGSAESMFRSAFYECTSLSDIPSNLFSGIDGAAKTMFQYAFYKTTGLTGKYIPPELFAGLHGQDAENMFSSVFINSNLLTSCPAGTIKYTGYSTYETTYKNSGWNNKVSCELEQVLTCTGARYKSGNVCLDCPIGYTYNTQDGKTSIDQCTMHCSAGTWTGEYERLDYIEATGTQYIDTGYVVSSTNLSADFEISSGVNVSGNIGHFAGNQDVLNGHAANFKDSVFGLWVSYPPDAQGHNGSKTKNGSSFNAGVIKTIHYGFDGNQRTLTVDGSPKTETFSGSIISNNTYRLFSNGCVGGCNDKMLEGRMHWFKLYENDVLVFDFIPVRRKTDNAIGMYDLVHGVFYGNSGTGDFVAGSVSETIGGSVCENVGYNYYSGATTTGYGSISERHPCENGEITLTENSTSSSDCHAAQDYTVCSAGTYLPANSETCASCTAGNWCPGGQLYFDTTDQGLMNCATEIGTGWSSDPGASAQTSCYYLITLNKNGFSGDINANSGIGCHVVNTALGRTNAQLKLFYNTRCTMPAISLTQSGYTSATGWAASNIVAASAVAAIEPVTSTPQITTYYARKTTCEEGYYKNGTTTCSVCPANSTTATANTSEVCTCNEGYTADGSSNGATVSANGCRIIGTPICAAGKYVPGGTTMCETCLSGSYCEGGEFTQNNNDQGIKNCATEIDTGWTSIAGAGAKNECYYPITLNKNGFSGTIAADSGTGCKVESTATGTNPATLKLFYNTACTLPSVDLTQTGYTNATNWSVNNTVNDTNVTTIAATSSTPSVTAYYARKASCAANYYKSGTTACSACGENSYTSSGNLSSNCTCSDGHTADGTQNGATVSTFGCSYVVSDTMALHVENRLYNLLSQRRTTPSVCVDIENTVYYVSLVPTEIPDALAIDYNNKVYSGCNISNNYCIENGVLYWADPNLYLKSSGTQYINTGVVPDLDTAVEVAMADTTINTYSLFGVKTGTLATTDEGFGISLSGGKFGFFRNGTSVSAIDKDENYHVYYLSNTDASIDGVPYSFASASSAPDSNQPMYIFGFNHDGAAYDKTLYVKYVKIWSGNTLVRHFVPVPTGLVIGNYTVPENGMFDIVNQTFYANPGVGDFQYGKVQ